MFNNDFSFGSTNGLAELSYQRYLASQQNQAKGNNANLVEIPNYSLLDNGNVQQPTAFPQGNYSNNNNFMDGSLFFNMNEPMDFLGSKYQDDIFASQLYKSKPWENMI